MFRKITFLLLTIAIITVMSSSIFVLGASQGNFPATCSGSTSCSVSNYADNNTATTGHHVAAGGTGTADSWGDFTSFPSSQTYDDVTLRFYHGAEAGVDGSWTITFRSEDGLTTYCTTTLAHTDVDTYVEINITTLNGCTWTTAELNDLEVVFANGDSMAPDDSFIYYAEIVATGSNSCDYGGSGNMMVDCTEGCGISANTNLLGNNITFNGSGTVTISANVYNWTVARVQNSCQVQTSGTGGLKWN